MTLKNFSSHYPKSIEKVLVFFLQTKIGVSVTSLKGGGNNQVFLIKHQNNHYVLKSYFPSKKQRHSRINSEYSFLEYAWKLGIRNIPKPLAEFKEDNIAIYSYISGRTPNQDDVEINEAIKFLLKLNTNRASIKLPKATESCFCFQDYIDTVDRKFSKLLASVKEKNQLYDFLTESFQPKWDRIKSNLIKKYESELKTHFPLDETFITPSDFGFHNAIIKNDMTYFIDFEYAGIDDIAKTVCDFFCQPKYPISMKYLSRFSSSLMQLAKDPANLVWRIHELMPVSQMKWCCIILNIFLKEGKKRREFSLSKWEESEQFNKAVEYFNNIKKEFLWPI